MSQAGVRALAAYAVKSAAETAASQAAFKKWAGMADQFPRPVGWDWRNAVIKLPDAWIPSEPVEWTYAPMRYYRRGHVIPASMSYKVPPFLDGLDIAATPDQFAAALWQVRDQSKIQKFMRVPPIGVPDEAAWLGSAWTCTNEQRLAYLYMPLFWVSQWLRPEEVQPFLNGYQQLQDQIKKDQEPGAGDRTVVAVTTTFLGAALMAAGGPVLVAAEKAAETAGSGGNLKQTVEAGLIAYVTARALQPVVPDNTAPSEATNVDLVVPNDATASVATPGFFDALASQAKGQIKSAVVHELSQYAKKPPLFTAPAPQQETPQPAPAAAPQPSAPQNTALATALGILMLFLPP